MQVNLDGKNQILSLDKLRCVLPDYNPEAIVYVLDPATSMVVATIKGRTEPGDAIGKPATFPIAIPPTPAPATVSLAKATPSHKGELTSSQKDVLQVIHRQHYAQTDAWKAKEFERRTGRPISQVTVAYMVADFDPKLGA